MTPGSIAIALSIFCLSCGGSELEFADWAQLTPDEGTPVFEYAGVSLEDRRDRRIDAVEDLVIGDDVSNPDQVFYRPNSVVAADDGTIYVLDAGNNRIQVFDAAGNYLQTLGQEGQGPGEFTRPSSLVIGADQLVLRADSRRLSTWTLAGQHVGDNQLLQFLSGLVGTQEGFFASYIIQAPQTDEEDLPPGRRIYALFNTAGEEIQPYAELTEPPPTIINVGGAILSMGFAPISDFVPRFVATRQGNVYVTASQEYQVHVYGTTPWALRVAWPREVVREADRETAMARLTSSSLFEEVDESDFEWPDDFPAITGLEVDGHGHLYVFPFFGPLNAPLGPDEERPEIDRPVDVYSAEGEHLFSGMIPVSSWFGSLGDHVYTTRINDATDEYEVVRYRLVEPFGR